MRACHSFRPKRRRRIVIREDVLPPNGSPEETVLPPCREGANRYSEIGQGEISVALSREDILPEDDIRENVTPVGYAAVVGDVRK